MPQNHSPVSRVTGAQLRQGLGYVPQRRVTGDATKGVEVDAAGQVALLDAPITPGIYGDLNNRLSLDIDQQGRIVNIFIIPATETTFGAGPPSAPGITEGDQYFNTTGAYAGYVWHTAAWHSF